MQISEYITKHLGEHRQKGKEIQVKICPMCQATEKDNQYKFSVNTETGLYQCFRGSCGAKGHINQLMRKDGIKTKEKITDNTRLFISEVKELNKNMIAITDSIKTQEYLKSRGISINTAIQYHCRATKSGELFFPIYNEEGQLVNYKRRNANSDKKSIHSKYGEMHLLGMMTCFDSTNPLIICEGEMDYLSILEATKEYNIVSIPAGTNNMKWIETNSKFLDRFQKIYIWFDNDEAGKKAVIEVASKLIEKDLYNITSDEKDANDVLLSENGKEKILQYINNAKQCTIEGITNITDIQRKDVSEIECVSTGIFELDVFTDGFRDGELTIWTGKNSSGKTTILGQTILQAIEEGKKVFAYSGEMTKETFQEWIFLQANGENEVVKINRKYSDKYICKVTNSNYKKISDWISEKLYIYTSNDTAKEDDLFKLMRVAYSKFGCRVFVLDNLMTILFSETEQNFYRQQSNFIVKVKNFCKNQNVHVHVVAHPRKTVGKVTKEDISGTGDITNLADNVIAMTRNDDASGSTDATLSLLKNRAFGDVAEIELTFDRNTRRFHCTNKAQEKNKKYSWEIEHDLEFPFKD